MLSRVEEKKKIFECFECCNAKIETFVDNRGVIHKFCKNCEFKWIENDGGKSVYGGKLAIESKRI